MSVQDEADKLVENASFHTLVSSIKHIGEDRPGWFITYYRDRYPHLKEMSGKHFQPRLDIIQTWFKKPKQKPNPYERILRSK